MSQPVVINLAAGINRSNNDKSAPPALRDMVNLDFTEDGAVVPRAALEHVFHADGKVRALARGRDGSTVPIDLIDCPVEVAELCRSSGTGRRVLEAVVNRPESTADSVARVVLVTLETNELSPTANFGIARVSTFDDNGVLLDSREIVDSEGMRGLQLTRATPDTLNGEDRMRLFWVRDTADTIHSQGLTVNFTTGNIFTSGAVKNHADSAGRTVVPPSWRARPYSVSERGNMLAAWFRAGSGDWRFAAVPLDVAGDISSASVQMATSSGLDIVHGDVSMCQSTTAPNTAVWFATHRGSGFVVARVNYAASPAAVVTTISYSGAVARTACVPYDTILASAPDDAVIMAYERLEEGCLSFASFTYDSAGGTVVADETSPNDHHTVGGLALADRGARLEYDVDGIGTFAKLGVLGVCNVSGAQAVGSRSYTLLAVTGPFSTRVIGKLANSEAGAYGTPALSGDDYSCPFPDVAITSAQADAALFAVLCTLRSTVDQTITGDSIDRWVRVAEVAAPGQALRFTGRTPDRVELGGETYMSGSYAFAHDGMGVHLGGFVHAPAWIDTSTGAGSLADGTYRFAVRATYATASGTLYDSPVTRYFPDKTAMTAVTAGSDKLDIDVVCGMVDLGSPSQSTARVDVFASAAPEETGDTLLRHLFTRSGQTDTSYSQQRATYSWTAPVTWHATGEILPDPLTGALAPGCVPGLRALCLHRGRLMGVDAFDPRIIRYTTEIIPPTGPTWPDEFFLPVANVGGPVVAVASLGDKLLLFQANSVSVVTGEGPTATGGSDATLMRSTAWSSPELIPGVGCREGSAVVETPEGVIVGHASGIYLFGFDLSKTNIGRAICGADAPFEWMCARYLPLRKQVWFLVRVASDAASKVAVWDTEFKVWTTFTTAAVLGGFADVLEANDGTVSLVGGNTYAVFTERGAGSTFIDVSEDDEDVPFAPSFTTTKVRGDDAGQIRMRRVTLVGQQDADPGTINAAVVVNTFNERRGGTETSTRTLTFDLTDFADSFQADSRAVTQRATEASVTVSLADQDPEVPTSKTLTLSRLVLHVDPVGGPGKAPVTKKAAAS